jgi:nitrous oxidase accessory protein
LRIRNALLDVKEEKKMRAIVSFFIIIISVCIGQVAMAAPNVDVQQLIDKTPNGDTLIIPSGTYIGPFTIKKSITIRTSGRVTFITPQHSKQAALTINRANDVTISKLHIESAGGMGIRVEQSGNVNLNKITISNETNKAKPLAQRLNGIDIFKSNHVRVEHALISGVHDGVYVEQSNHTQLVHNRVEHARYGYHFMYTKDDIVTNNYSKFNVTGAMLMEVKNMKFNDNQLLENNDNVTSQGLLLFVVQDSQLKNNQIRGNRVGIYVEHVKSTSIASNHIADNRVGIYVNNMMSSTIEKNDFIGNVSQVNSLGVDDSVSISHNYWEDFQGIPTKDKQSSQLPNVIRSPLVKMSNSVPAYLLFFRAPGMAFFEQVLGDPVQQPLIDQSPALERNLTQNEQTQSHSTVTWWIGVCILLSSIFIYVRGGRQRG